jgi:hypothetical protein
MLQQQRRERPVDDHDDDDHDGDDRPDGGHKLGPDGGGNHVDVNHDHDDDHNGDG